MPMYRTFIRVFQALPLCTLIGESLGSDGTPRNDNCIFVVHGGEPQPWHHCGAPWLTPNPMHGGIFENKTVKIHHIDKLPRKNYPSLIAPKPRRNETPL
jgi:hypothetical protein